MRGGDEELARLAQHPVRKVAFDNNRLGRITQRRVCAAWCERHGHPVWVLPQVASEILPRTDPRTVETLDAQAEEELARRGNQLGRWRLLDLKMRIWWAREWQNPQGLYRLGLLDAMQEDHARELREEKFEARLFPKVKPQDIATLSDAIIVSEALASGVPVLMTRNMDLIDHGEMNRWVREHRSVEGFASDTVVFQADRTFMHQHSGKRWDLGLSILLGAAWEGPASTSARMIEERADAMFERLPGAGFEECSERWGSAWRQMSTRQREKWIDEVRQTLPERMLTREEQMKEIRGGLGR